MISAVRGRIDRLARRIAWLFERLGLTPNGVTFLALVVASAGAYLIATGHLIWGAGIAGLGSVLDAFDGALARRTGDVTTFGGYLDSLLDRYVDGIVFFAVGWYYDTLLMWALVFAALLGALATSYAKARTYQDASPDPTSWPDLIERAERLILLLFGVGIQGIVFAVWGGPDFLPWLVGLLAVLGHLTVIQRAWRAKGFLEGTG